MSAPSPNIQRFLEAESLRQERAIERRRIEGLRLLEGLQVMRKRVNPRVNRDLPEQVIEDKHPPADVRTEDLHQAVNSTGWHTIAAENLRKRCRAIERKLAIDRNLQAEARLRLQHRYEAYEQILDDPMGFFGSDGSDEA